MRFFYVILLVVLSLPGVAQTTIGTKPKTDVTESAYVLAPGKKHKVMVIPFLPKMYMSQIDHKINAETKWDQKKIRASFREGIDEELGKKLKSKFDVLCLLDDTVKYKKDIAGIYQYLS